MITKHLKPFPQGRFNNITGQKYGMLTAIGYAGREGGSTKWLFRCDCGTEKIIISGNVVSGSTISCGCYTRRITSERSVKHGMFKKPVYNVWDSMKQRCNNPKHQSFNYYGGRGVSVCDRWDDFSNFYEDMGDRPSPKHSIERIDVNGNYEPNNCYWATPEQQANNKRDTIYHEFNDESLTAPQWAQKTGIPYHTIKNRLRKGWSMERTVTTPNRARRRNIK